MESGQVGAINMGLPARETLCMAMGKPTTTVVEREMVSGREVGEEEEEEVAEGM